jgi:hypothetical protein
MFHSKEPVLRFSSAPRNSNFRRDQYPGGSTVTTWPPGMVTFTGLRLFIPLTMGTLFFFGMPVNRDLVSRFESAVIPSHAAAHDIGRVKFHGPGFGVALVIFYFKKQQRMRILPIEFLDSSVDRSPRVDVPPRCAVMRGNARGQDAAAKNHQENGQHFMLHPATPARLVEGQTLRVPHIFVKRVGRASACLVLVFVNLQGERQTG